MKSRKERKDARSIAPLDYQLGDARDAIFYTEEEMLAYAWEMGREAASREGYESEEKVS